ncbi:hypothetical protein [uncultured Roseibium sp.]|uniref:phage adaptor protein n=1 Tax=uncultured Roseibium sp. TaxID=1936171 RepID=UPI002615924F|nr:hypothetical protein [uncultured Roseibium sp.]
MAFDNLADLKTELQKYRGRSDTEFMERLDGFVALFESRANIDLPIRTAEVNTTLTGAIGSRSIDLPADFSSPIAVFLTTYGTEDFLSPIIAGNYELGTTNGTPRAWMINGSKLDFDVPCDQEHTFKFRYRMTSLDLATTDPNWLLTNHPNTYLYGCLKEAAVWSRDFQDADAYESLYMDAEKRISWNESRSKSVAPLRVDPALSTTGGYNINSDSFNGVG